MTLPFSGAAFSDTSFSKQVSARFGRRAARYSSQAHLQQGVAWRLAHLCRHLPLPASGSRADLGAGSGLVGQALQRQGWAEQLQQLDLCPELLAHNPLASPPRALHWNLNQGLPRSLQQAALLTSSFALQWLDDPAGHLQHWCEQLQPGGWLALAVPTSASFPQWHQAAAAAGVACTALPLPSAEALLAAANLGGLKPLHLQRLSFSRSYGSGLGFLQQLKTLGADSSRSGQLSPSQLRRLLACWPADGQVKWEVLMLVGQRPKP